MANLFRGGLCKGEDSSILIPAEYTQLGGRLKGRGRSKNNLSKRGLSVGGIKWITPCWKEFGHT